MPNRRRTFWSVLLGGARLLRPASVSPFLPFFTPHLTSTAAPLSTPSTSQTWPFQHHRQSPRLRQPNMALSTSQRNHFDFAAPLHQSFRRLRAVTAYKKITQIWRAWTVSGGISSQNEAAVLPKQTIELHTVNNPLSTGSDTSDTPLVGPLRRQHLHISPTVDKRNGRTPQLV